MRCEGAFLCGTNGWVEAAGYPASLLVFATFCMKTMIPAPGRGHSMLSGDAVGIGPHDPTHRRRLGPYIRGRLKEG
jgi:hypothetical protein